MGRDYDYDYEYDYEIGMFAYFRLVDKIFSRRRA